MSPKDLIKQLLTDEMIEEAFESCKRFKDKNVSYGNFLKIINQAVYAGFLLGHEVNEENQKLWRDVSRSIHNLYSSQRFHSNNIKPHLTELKTFQTESFDSYDHVLYLSVDEALAYVKGYYKNSNKARKKSEHIYILDYKVKAAGLKLKTFLEHGKQCSCCKVKGTFFSVSKAKNLTDSNSYHLAMWGISSTGKPVLFTHDHTLARGLGGKNNVANTTTMCFDCNNSKSAEETKLASIHRQSKKAFKPTAFHEGHHYLEVEQTVLHTEDKKKHKKMAII